MGLLIVPEHKGVHVGPTGSYVPERRVTAADLSQHLGCPLTEDEILHRTGVQERRWVADDEATSDMAVAAGRLILDRAAVEELDRILLSTNSPDHISPGAACFVQAGLGVPPCPSMDLVSACSGFVFGLDLGARSVLTGETRVLVLASEVRSRFLNLEDRSTCALFGDGAAGTLMSPGPPGQGLLGTYTSTDGRGGRSVYVPAGGSREPASLSTVSNSRHTIRMENGVEVMVLAVQHLASVAETLLEALSMTLEDVDLIVPHQANARFTERLARFMRLPLTRFMNVAAEYGNTSSASAAIALDVALETERAGPGANILLLVAGGGYSVGAALIKVP